MVKCCIGAEPDAIRDVRRSAVATLAVLISHLQELLSAFRPHLKPESLVVDVCSVKEPVRWVQDRRLPAVAAHLEVVKNDTWQLFEDMNRYNPYAQDARQAFITAMNEIKGKLRG